MKEVELNIDSKVNEAFIKTFITQKILNDSDNPIEIETYFKIYKWNFIFFVYCKIR